MKINIFSINLNLNQVNLYGFLLLYFLINSSNLFAQPSCQLDGIGMSMWYGDSDSQSLGDSTSDDEDGDDFISFANFSNSDVDISGWQLYVDQFGSSNPVFTFPSSTILSPYDEVTVIADWNGSNPLPSNWFSPNYNTGEGFFEETSNNVAYAILKNPNTNQYVTWHHRGDNGQSLSSGTKVCNSDFISFISNDFEGCEMIYWNSSTNDYREITDCLIPKIADSDGDGITEGLDPNDSDACDPDPCSTVAGTIDCTKTQVLSAPVEGQSEQKVLLVFIDVSSEGCFSPISVSGSGMTLATGFTQVCTSITGFQQFYIPVDYDGSTLGTVNFNVGNAGSCSADLTLPSKKVVSEVWTLDCVTRAAPSLH